MESAGIKIEHATVKHAQTIGMVERSHQNLKQILKINISADSPQWNIYVNMAVMAHNTTYHQATRCTPTEVFHGRIPFNALDVKFGNPLTESRNTTDVTGMLDNMNKKFQQTLDNIIEAFHKYKNYYDRKAQASILKINYFILRLNQRLSEQSEKNRFKEFKWEGPYKVVKVLSNSNYIIRKIGTLRTQCVHRMRLRPFTPNAPIEDITDDSSQYFEDPDALNEQELLDNHIPTPVTEQPQQAIPEQSDFEELHADHGIIYYKRQSVEHDQNNSIPECQAETQHPDNTSMNSPETINNEHQTIERLATTSRNTMSRYGLIHNPKPTTYPDFLMHELHGTPTLQ